MDDRPETEPTPDSADALQADGWGGAPVTKFRCPIHSVTEEWQIVSHGGERMIHYSCPVEGCDHEWTVKRIRL